MTGIYYPELLDVLRAAGCKVAENATTNGWQTRARSSGGFPAPPLAVWWHHTASSTSPANDLNYMIDGSDDAPVGNVVQIDAYFAGSNALNAHVGNLPTDVITHQVWAPTRKIDPATAAAVQGPWKPRSCTSSGTWDLDDIRAECNRRATPDQEDDMPLTDDDIERIAERVWQFQINDALTGKKANAASLLGWTRKDAAEAADNTD
jgi:hypothetical protein